MNYQYLKFVDFGNFPAFKISCAMYEYENLYVFLAIIIHFLNLKSGNNSFKNHLKKLINVKNTLFDFQTRVSHVRHYQTTN